MSAIINSNKNDEVEVIFGQIKMIMESLKMWYPTQACTFEKRDLGSTNDIDGFRDRRSLQISEGHAIRQYLLPYIALVTAPDEILSTMVVEFLYERYVLLKKSLFDINLKYNAQRIGFQAAKAEHMRLMDIRKEAYEYNVFTEEMKGVAKRVEQWFRKNGVSDHMIVDKKELDKMLEKHGDR